MNRLPRQIIGGVGRFVQFLWNVVGVITGSMVIIVSLWMSASVLFGTFEFTSDPCCRIFSGFPS